MLVNGDDLACSSLDGGEIDTELIPCDEFQWGLGKSGAGYCHTLNSFRSEKTPRPSYPARRLRVCVSQGRGSRFDLHRKGPPYL